MKKVNVILLLLFVAIMALLPLFLKAPTPKKAACPKETCPE